MFLIENSVDFQHQTYSKVYLEICLTPLFTDIRPFTSKRESEKEVYSYNLLN